MLRLTKNQKRKYISLHISLAPQYWDAEKCKPHRNCPDKERIESLIQQKTQELQSQVMDFKTSAKEYTLNTLLEKASRKVVRRTVGEYLNGYIDRLLAANRVGGVMPPFSSQAPVCTQSFETRSGQWNFDGRNRFYGKSDE